VIGVDAIEPARSDSPPARAVGCAWTRTRQPAPTAGGGQVQARAENAQRGVRNRRTRNVFSGLSSSVAGSGANPLMDESVSAGTLCFVHGRAAARWKLSSWKRHACIGFASFSPGLRRPRLHPAYVWLFVPDGSWPGTPGPWEPQGNHPGGAPPSEFVVKAGGRLRAIAVISRIEGVPARHGGHACVVTLWCKIAPFVGRESGILRSRQGSRRTRSWIRS